MSAIPLHIQRKFERRWAAKFASPVASAVPKTTGSKGTVNNWPRPAKASPLTNRDPSMAETGAWVPARPHDSGSQSNETVDGLDSTTEALRHAAEDTASGAAPDDIEKTPVFDRAGLAPKI
jgi:hypothetical protein